MFKGLRENIFRELIKNTMWINKSQTNTTDKWK